MEELRKTLLAYIAAVSKLASGKEDFQLRTHLVIGCDEYGMIWCGLGYFQLGKVLWWSPGGYGTARRHEELTPEEAVDRYLANVSAELKRTEVKSDEQSNTNDV